MAAAAHRLVPMALVGALLVGPPSGAAREHVSRSPERWSTPHSVIIDCDPAGMIWTGLDVDDDLALAAAVALNRTGQLHLLGITTTAGNAPLAQTHADALELRRRLGLQPSELPVHAGARWWPPPWSRQVGQAVNYMPTDASSFIIGSVMQAPADSVTLLCLGPLTNIAAALHLQPMLASRLRSLVIMGGSLDGETTDFNFRFDRTAADLVLGAEVPKLLIPVETAIQATFGTEQLRKLRGDSKSAPACCPTQTVGTSTAPVVCSLLPRIEIQTYVMPWLVNWRFWDKDLPGSAMVSKGLESAMRWTEAGNAFILWDVVALFALSSPALFADWSRYEVSVIGDGWGELNASRVPRSAVAVGAGTTYPPFPPRVGSPLWLPQRRDEGGSVVVAGGLRQAEQQMLGFLHELLCTVPEAAPLSSAGIGWLTVIGVLPHCVFVLVLLVGGGQVLWNPTGLGAVGSSVDDNEPARGRISRKPERDDSDEDLSDTDGDEDASEDDDSDCGVDKTAQSSRDSSPGPTRAKPTRDDTVEETEAELLARRAKYASGRSGRLQMVCSN